MDKLIQLLVAAMHGIVIQKVPLRLRVGLAILLTGLVATLHHFAISRGWLAPEVADLWSARADGAIFGVFVVSVTGRPNEISGLIPGLAVVPPASPQDERPDKGGVVGVVTPAPPADSLTRLK